MQHALRAFTPRDQKAVRTAAETFVPNPRIDVVQAITTLGVGIHEGGRRPASCGTMLLLRRDGRAPPLRVRRGNCTHGDGGELVLMRGGICSRFVIMVTPSNRLLVNYHNMPVSLAGTGDDSGEEFRAREADGSPPRN